MNWQYFSNVRLASLGNQRCAHPTSWDSEISSHKQQRRRRWRRLRFKRCLFEDFSFRKFLLLQFSLSVYVPQTKYFCFVQVNLLPFTSMHILHASNKNDTKNVEYLERACSRSKMTTMRVEAQTERPTTRRREWERGRWRAGEREREREK